MKITSTQLVIVRDLHNDIPLPLGKLKLLYFLRQLALIWYQASASWRAKIRTHLAFGRRGVDSHKKTYA